MPSLSSAALGGGARIERARVTVRWNGALVHDGIELPGSTAGGDPETRKPGPIVLHDHGQRVRYRNVWIQPLE